MCVCDLPSATCLYETHLPRYLCAWPPSNVCVCDSPSAVWLCVWPTFRNVCVCMLPMHVSFERCHRHCNPPAPMLPTTPLASINYLLPQPPQPQIEINCADATQWREGRNTGRRPKVSVLVVVYGQLSGGCIWSIEWWLYMVNWVVRRLLRRSIIHSS